MNEWTHADRARLIPVDAPAEWGAAGAAVMDQALALDLVDLAGPDLFHDRRCWDVIEVAAATPDVLHRVPMIAEATGMPEAQLSQWAFYAVPNTVALARRLQTVDQARRYIRHLLDRLDKVGVEVRLLTDIDDEMSHAHAGILRCAQALGALLAGTGSDADMIDALVSVGARFGLRPSEIAEAARPPEGPDE